jgi:plastocyanin/mono/diheme cytochrome c family protein
VGAVQKLATVVIIGLVAMATVLVVYLADEPNRRGSQTDGQGNLAIERGTDLYITYCLQCHGPSGFGAAGQEDPARIGAPLNQSHLVGNPQFEESDTIVAFQSDDPVEQETAENYIRYMITYGIPQDPRVAEKQMPSFAADLNVEEINDIVYLVMNGDWDYVYNQAVLFTGNAQAQAECDADPSNHEACENAHNEDFALYPTAPPEEDAGDDLQADGTPEAAEGGDGSLLLEAQDPYAWSQTDITLAPGDTFEVVNAGAAQHDFTVDELGIAEVLTGDPITITIPEDAEPGTYEFYCSIPGHRENGMVGTLTIEAP